MEDILHQAGRLEKEYDWLEAVESYGEALKLSSEDDFSRMAQIFERLGCAFYRAAMQAKSQEEFKERMKRAIDNYEKAHEFYERLIDKQKTAHMFRCKAVASYIGYWLASAPSEKRKLLDECIELEDKALVESLESGDMLEYGKTYNELSLAFSCRFYLEWDRQTAESIVKRGVEWGEKAVASLSEIDNSYEIARAHFTLATCLALLGESFIAEPEEREKNRLKVVKYLSGTVKLSEKLDDAYLLGSSHLWWGANAGGEEALKHFEKTLECGKLARDNFLIAWGSDFLAFMIYWKAIATEDPEKRREMAEKAMRFYDEAQHHFAVMSYASPRIGVIAPPAGSAEHYLDSAAWETDLNKKLEFLEKSEKAGTQALKEAEASDMPAIVAQVFHVISKTLEARAYVEPETPEKRSRLERALKCREKAIEILDQIAPFDYWDRGVMQNYLAEIKGLLAGIEPNLDSKRRLLEEAVLSKEKCIELCSKIVPYIPRTGDVSLFAGLQGYQDSYVTILTWLYELTNDPENLRKAIEASQKAIECAKKLDMISRAAESYWKMAQAQDFLGEHSKAAESFKHASEGYMKAAEEIPKLKSFYQDHAVYMQAWTAIEKGRHHHERQEYSLAKEHFEKAADLHKSLKPWSYLASNYSAWAQVENGEELSRKEQSEEAIKAFEQAATLFSESKKSLQTQLAKIESLDETQMANNMVSATDVRREYCMARIAVEEGRILDKQGDHYRSSEKYGSAVDIFERMNHASDSERERQEFKLVISLSEAWQKMTLAEAESSPELYLQASQLFEEAKNLSPNEKTKLLVLGHSRFCRALEAGTRFVDTRNRDMYMKAIECLESAASYYLKAGFPKASEYSEATKLLFDAYMHMDSAAKENDMERKAKLYAMAQRVLQTSAGSYLRAEHPEKGEQVLGLLEKAKKEHELAVSLTEVLHAPTIVSTTSSFNTPAPTREEAVGSERFEHADIQGNLMVRKKELTVGEPFDLEIDLVNAGKMPALLIKVNEAIPNGFELVGKPDNCRVEDSFVNMKGRRLDPLKSEEIKLVLKPKVQGTFALKPTILYLDENTKYKSHEVEPITITVKELGIKGWLKGEG